MAAAKSCENCGWMDEALANRFGCDTCTRQPEPARTSDNWRPQLPFDHKDLSWGEADMKDRAGWDVRRPTWISAIASWSKGPDGAGWSIEDLRARDYFIVGRRESEHE